MSLSLQVGRKVGRPAKRSASSVDPAAVFLPPLNDFQLDVIAVLLLDSVMCVIIMFFSLPTFLVYWLIVAAPIRTSCRWLPDLADCNRTYYAEMGESYRLLVTWPKSNHLPFVCYLTFTSVTHDPAEILQVSRLRLIPSTSAPPDTKCL